MRPPASRAFRRAAYRTALFVFLCGSVGSHTPPGWPLLGALASAVPERAIAPRLSITSVYRACPSALRDGETIPRTDCGPLPGREGRARGVDAVQRRAARMRRLRLDSDALQAQGLLDLLAADSVGNSLGQSISSFDLSRRRSKRRASVLADQAAAHLLRAERTQSVKELAQALELAQEATGLEPGNPVALFNRALALDRLAVDGRAVEAWEAYLAVDSTSEWAGEARARVHALAPPHPAPAPPVSADSAGRVEAYVAAAPLEARELGWDRLLGEWAEAVLG
ncbi:MAG TPA: hypothetical protein VHG91_11435, partial [Longimicrobium sp.]|nr:hypothetical protein [Longimicrobium sp.]